MLHFTAKEQGEKVGWSSRIRHGTAATARSKGKQWPGEHSDLGPNPFMAMELVCGLTYRLSSASLPV